MKIWVQLPFIIFFISYITFTRARNTDLEIWFRHHITDKEHLQGKETL